MKAAVYRSYGPPEVVQIQDIPNPNPKSDEVLIKVFASTVNRTDCGFRSAEYFISRFWSGLFRPNEPVLGSEFAGEVVSVGEKVKKFQATIEGRQKELKKLNDEMEKQKMMLSAEAKAEKERDYQQKVKEFQRFAKDAQDELQQQDAQYTRSILEDLFKVVKDLGTKGGYTLILEKTESSVLYADDAINLTDEVIAAYNKVYKKAK